MFTGLIEEEGKIIKVLNLSFGKRIEVKTSLPVNIGDSVSVDGVCLTVEDLKKDIITFFLSNETLKRTKFKTQIKTGQFVNLERALRADSFVGGHFVTGHVDTTGEVKSIKREGNSYKLTVSYPTEYVKFLVEKGSVAIDGISLTVNEVKPTYFTVQIIPHTFNVTTVKRMRAGYKVNLEFDMIGKYVVKTVENYLRKIRTNML